MLKRVLSGSSSTIEEMVEAVFIKFPDLRERVEKFDPPRTILDDALVKVWLDSGTHASIHFVLRVKYFVIRVARGDKIDQHRPAKTKVRSI